MLYLVEQKRQKRLVYLSEYELPRNCIYIFLLFIVVLPKFQTIHTLCPLSCPSIHSIFMEHPTVERHRRRSKGKERAIPRDLPRPVPRPQDVPLPSSPEAGPSKLSAQQQWEYVPIAQNEISSVPPVWSRDGRYVVVTLPHERHS